MDFFDIKKIYFLWLSIDCKRHRALDHFPWEFFSILPISQSIGCSYIYIWLIVYYSLGISFTLFIQDASRRWRKLLKNLLPGTAFIIANMHPMLWMIRKQLHSYLFSFKYVYIKYICCILFLVNSPCNNTQAMTLVTNYLNWFTPSIFQLMVKITHISRYLI